MPPRSQKLNAPVPDLALENFRKNQPLIKEYEKVLGHKPTPMMFTKNTWGYRRRKLKPDAKSCRLHFGQEMRHFYAESQTEPMTEVEFYKWKDQQQ